MKILFLCLIGLAIFSTSPTFAYFEEYPPYKFKDGAPKHLEIKSLVSKQEEYKDGSTLVRFQENKDWSFKLLIKDDKTTIVDNDGEPPLPQGVYQADLDHNGQKDFIVLSWNMGTGLGGHEGTVDIYLKEKEGLYHKISFITMDAGIEDFIDPDKDGKYEVIITNVYSGKEHTYFTYDIYEFKNFKLVNADSKFIGFPKFVWYTHKKNDKDTTHLSVKERHSHVQEKNASIKYDGIQ
jgi:hypothetical protein